jgi:hypothetical protein
MKLAQPRLFTLDLNDPRSANFCDWAFGALLIFNALDGAFTTLWVQSGQATEANPVMAALLHVGVLPFFAAKVLLVTLGGAALWHASKRPLAQLGLIAVLALYAAVIAVHLEHMHQLLG